MIQVTANVSPIISYQFPEVYRQEGPNLVSFAQAYFKWLEQSGNALYYIRNLYSIHDIDNTFDQFIVYFKEKYLKNIPFSTQTNIRTVVKHALDIYRSKGTERGTTLLFQLAFDEIPWFYYPSTDLFKLSDGVWTIPQYLELSVNWSYNIQLQQKEVVGVFSGATAFVDNVIRRRTNNRLQDIAYISAIAGEFQTGEKIQPTDGSISIDNCPVITGSLNSLIFPSTGSGQYYTVGENIDFSSTNGLGGTLLVTDTINQPGLIGIQFNGGGFGYQISQHIANVGYSNASATPSSNSNIYSYDSNGAVLGIGFVTNVNASNSTAGYLSAEILTGNLDAVFYSYANNLSANIVEYSVTNLNPTDIYISNSTLILSNVTMNSTNLEFVHYFSFLDTITEPMASLNYIEANGSFSIGSNIYTYFSNNAAMGQGIIMAATQTNSTAGSLLVSVVSGNVGNTFYTTSNAVTAELALSNGYTNSTASAMFIANTDSVGLLVNNISGSFIIGENVFQQQPLSLPTTNEKTQGWGILESIDNNTLTINTVSGRFINDSTIIGEASQATANVISMTVTVGVVNNVNQFIASPYSNFNSPLLNGCVTSVFNSGNGFSVLIANNLLYPESVSLNIDKLSDYSDVALSATTYGFPANPEANSTTGTLQSCMNMADAVIGQLANVYIGGTGTEFDSTAFVVLDNPQVSSAEMYNIILQLDNITGSFTVNEIIQQAESNVKAQIISSNNNFITVMPLSLDNDFVVTTDANSLIFGLLSGTQANVISVDYDYMSPVMGQNANISTLFINGDNALLTGKVITSGFGFVDGEATIGSNGASATAVVSTQGQSVGYYNQKGGFLSDQKKLFDGYYWQNFSYQIISSLMVEKYTKMMNAIAHPAGMIMFGEYVHNSLAGGNLAVQNAIIKTSNQNVFEATATVGVSAEQIKSSDINRTAQVATEVTQTKSVSAQKTAIVSDKLTINTVKN